MPSTPCLSPANTSVLVFSGWTSMLKMRSVVTLTLPFRLISLKASLSSATPDGSFGFPRRFSFFATSPSRASLTHQRNDDPCNAPKKWKAHQAVDIGLFRLLMHIINGHDLFPGSAVLDPQDLALLLLFL